MNKQDAATWAEALRSGVYKQGQFQLHREIDDTYCCLGVLNKIMPEKYPRHKTDDLLLVTVNFSSERGCIKNYWDTVDTDLAYLNDDDRCFDQIADIIEKHYKEL